MSSVCIIPARSGSTRLPNKNIFPVHGMPMFYWSYTAALRSNLYEEIYLTTDSEHYAELAHEHGIKTIIRPYSISDNVSPKQQAIVHAKQFLQSSGKHFDLYMSLQANSPDVQVTDLLNMHTKLVKDKRWEVITVDSNLNQNGIARLMRSDVVDNKSLSAVLGAIIANRSNIHTVEDVKTLEMTWIP